MIAYSCGIPREDPCFVESKGLRRAFFTGSNTSCRAHIRGHYQIYKERCEVDGIKMKEHCIPRKLLKSQSAGSGALSQTTLDNAVEPKTTKEFSKDAILHAVAQLVACDDQVSRVRRGVR